MGSTPYTAPQIQDSIAQPARVPPFISHARCNSRIQMLNAGISDGGESAWRSSICYQYSRYSITQTEKVPSLLLGHPLQLRNTDAQRHFFGWRRGRPGGPQYGTSTFVTPSLNRQGALPLACTPATTPDGCSALLVRWWQGQS